MAFLKRIFQKIMHVNWYCDNCDAYMNNQDNFTTDYGKWKCEFCGFVNDVTENNIGNGNKPKQEYFSYVKNMKCQFNILITKEIFIKLVANSANGIKRLKIHINEASIIGVVTSISGTNDWRFGCNFNDCGQITGNYLDFWTENYDSGIPKTFILRLSRAIKEIYKDNNIDPLEGRFACPNCGHDLKKQYYDIEKCFFWKCRQCNEEFYLEPHTDKSYNIFDDK